MDASGHSISDGAVGLRGGSERGSSDNLVSLHQNLQ